MGCINVGYEKKFTISSVVWIYGFIFDKTYIDKNVFDLQQQLVIKEKINKL